MVLVICLQSNLIHLFYITGGGLKTSKPSNKLLPPGGGGGYDVSYYGQSYFINLDRRVTANFINIAGQINITASSKLEVADVNGDGKSDLMVFQSRQFKGVLFRPKQCIGIIHYKNRCKYFIK